MNKEKYLRVITERKQPRMTIVRSLVLGFLLTFVIIPTSFVSADTLDIKVNSQRYAPVQEMGDFSYNGSHFWIPDPAKERLLVLNRNFRIVDELTFEEFTINTRMACTFNETHFFLGKGGPNTIYAININTWQVTELPEVASFEEAGFLISFQYLNGELYGTYLSEQVYVMRVQSATTGALLRAFKPGLKTPYGVTTDENGSLWVTDYQSSFIVQMDPLAENSQTVAPPYIRRYYTPSYPDGPRGVVYDGENLFIAVGGMIYQCDPGEGIYPEPEGFPFHIFLPVVTIVIIFGGLTVLLSVLRDPQDALDTIQALRHRIKRNGNSR